MRFANSKQRNPVKDPSPQEVVDPRSTFHPSRSRRSSSGSSHRQDKSQIPCRFFKEDDCKRGDKCPFKHDASSPSAAVPTRERAGSPAAKSKRDKGNRERRSQGRRNSDRSERRSRRGRNETRSRKPSPRSKSAESSTSAPCIQFACGCFRK